MTESPPARGAAWGHDAGMLNAHEERRVAVAATCDPRTVRRYFAGRPIRPTSAARIRAALAALAIRDPQQRAAEENAAA